MSKHWSVPRKKTDRVGKDIKSEKNEQRSFVTFVNRTERLVDVCWVNYKGELVHYNTISAGLTQHMNTFVTHPWIFKDHDTGDRLSVGGQDVYFPVAWNGENVRAQVYVDIPVFPLTVRCLQILKKFIPAEEYEKLEIPVTLIEDLARKENRPCPIKYVHGQLPRFVPHDQEVEQDTENNEQPQEDVQ